MDRPIRWGIMGCARIAEKALIPAIIADPDARLTAIAGSDGAKAANWADRFGAARSHAGYAALLDDPEVEAVYIPLVTAAHVPWTLKALAAGKHVLCEKPIALDAGQIDDLIAARDRSGLVAGEAFMVAHHPQWAQVRAWIDSGAIGSLRQVQGAFAYRNLDPANMRNRADLGGGALLDIGVYPMVTTRLATGAEPLTARATVIRDPAFGTDAFASATLAFPGFELSFYVSTQMALRQSMVFHGETGMITLSAPFNAGSYDAAEARLDTVDRTGAETRRWPGVDQYRLMVEQFGRAVRGKEPLAFTLEASKANQAAIDAVFAAGARGETVGVARG